VHAHRLHFDGDAALTLKLHRVEYLIAHFALFNGACKLQKAVSQGRLTVIYVGYDAEITYMLHGGESTTQNQL
jgi:hypothetical protein